MANNHSRKNVTKGLAVIVILCITCAVLGSVVGLTSGVFKHSQNITATQEMQYAFDNPNEMLSVVRLNTGVTIRGCDAEVCGTNYSEFQITNNSNMVLAIIATKRICRFLLQTRHKNLPSRYLFYSIPKPFKVASAFRRMVFCWKDKRVLSQRISPRYSKFCNRNRNLG